MKLVLVDKNWSVEVPETWREAEDMLTHALGSYYDERGRNIMRLSIVARVAHGMFGDKWMSPNPSTTLLYLLQRICQLKGASLDHPKR